MLKNREKAQVFEGMLSIAINVLLFGAKFWAGILTGSIALVADAWHTLSDSISSIVVIIAARLSVRKPDKEHPFGHGRLEHVASFIVAVFLGIIGYEFLSDSITRFRDRESVYYGAAAIVVTVVSLVGKEVLAQVAFYIGKKTGNSVVKADGWHHRTDALSSLIILIGIIVTRFTESLWWMDSVLGMVCALLIFYAAFEILRDTVSALLGEEPDASLTKEIEEKINAEYGDLRIHHFHLHNYVLHKEMTLHLMVDGDMSVAESHNIATRVEGMLEADYGITATIHIEPAE